MNDNYYDILNIPQDAGEGAIKKAYILKLREYPVEKYPEEFKEIRKAYEVLSNPKTRKEYDAMAIYGAEIEDLQEKARIALENSQFEKAADSFKKILLIEPSLIHIRNQYALALIYSGEYDKAIKQLERLITQEKDNAVYLYNIGNAYKSKGDLNQAINYFKQAAELDPNDVNIIFEISDTYLDLVEYDKAKNVIKEAMDKKTNQGFHQFMYLFRLLQVDVFSKNFDAIRNTLNQIEELLRSHPEEKMYVANEFGKFASELFMYKQFELAYLLTEKGVALDPLNEDLKGLHQSTLNNKSLYKEFEYLKDDENIIMPLRYNLFLYLFSDELPDEEVQSSIDTMYHNVEQFIKHNPEETISSIKRLNIKYPELYRERKDFFEEVLTLSEKNKARYDDFDKLKQDSAVLNSLSRLLALYLSDIDDDERQDYFEDIMNHMSFEEPLTLVKSINYVKRNYPSLYSLNPEFLEEIKKKLSEVSHNKNVNSQQINKTPSPSTSSSCFVATAAFGSPLNAELDYLRFWRDHYLNKSIFGKAFIRFYYMVGPFMAIPVRNSAILKRVVQKIIFNIIKIIDKRQNLKMHFFKQVNQDSKKVISRNE